MGRQGRQRRGFEVFYFLCNLETLLMALLGKVFVGPVRFSKGWRGSSKASRGVTAGVMWPRPRSQWQSQATSMRGRSLRTWRSCGVQAAFHHNIVTRLEHLDAPNKVKLSWLGVSAADGWIWGVGGGYLVAGAVTVTVTVTDYLLQSKAQRETRHAHIHSYTHACIQAYTYMHTYIQVWACVSHLKMRTCGSN